VLSIFFEGRRGNERGYRAWSSGVCSSDLSGARTQGGLIPERYWADRGRRIRDAIPVVSGCAGSIGIGPLGSAAMRIEGIGAFVADRKSVVEGKIGVVG